MKLGQFIWQSIYDQISLTSRTFIQLRLNGPQYPKSYRFMEHFSMTRRIDFVLPTAYNVARFYHTWKLLFFA